MSAVPDPGVVMGYLETAAETLETLGQRLEGAHLELGEAEAAWDGIYDDGLRVIEGECRRLDERLPGEDVRISRVRRRGDEERLAWERFVKAKAEVKAVEGHVRRVENAVSARQSTLKGLVAAESNPAEGRGKPPIGTGRRSQYDQGRGALDPETGEVLVS